MTSSDRAGQIFSRRLDCKRTVSIHFTELKLCSQSSLPEWFRISPGQRDILCEIWKMKMEQQPHSCMVGKQCRAPGAVAAHTHSHSLWQPGHSHSSWCWLSSFGFSESWGCLNSRGKKYVREEKSNHDIPCALTVNRIYMHIIMKHKC